MIEFIYENNKCYRRDTKDGTLDGEKTYCPVNGWDCPYYKEGVCHIDNPLDDCDDWGAFFETWQDWIDA